MLFVIFQIWPSLLAAVALGGVVGWILNRTLAEYTPTRDLPDLSAYLTIADLPAPGDAPSGDLYRAPDLSAFVRREELELFARSLESAPPAGRQPAARVNEVPHAPADLLHQLIEREREVGALRQALHDEQVARNRDIERLESLLRRQPSRSRRDKPPAPARADDLKRIAGIGSGLAKRLNRMGVYTFADIAAWTDSDVDRIEPQLATVPNRIRREQWVAHAGRLHRETHGESASDDRREDALSVEGLPDDEPLILAPTPTENPPAVGTRAGSPRRGTRLDS